MRDGKIVVVVSVGVSTAEAVVVARMTRWMVATTVTSVVTALVLVTTTVGGLVVWVPLLLQEQRLVAVVV